MNQAPLVSILCTAYNHEAFIQDALEGFVTQQTNFSFEIIVHDDASTDKTVNIIREYEAKYPNLFFNIYQTENQYSKGKGDVGKIIFGAARGKYVALCEGDDYWTDPLKLQKQIDFLEANEDFAICSSNAILKNEIDCTENEWLGKKQREISTLKDILRYGSGGATCTLVFRSQAIKELPDWYYSLAGGDWALQIICTSIGKMKYFREVFAVYRRNAGGITATNSIDNSILVYENYGIKTIDILIDNFSNYKNELQTHAVEHIYYNLAFLYYNKGNMDKTRLIIRKILQKILKIDISFKNIVHLIILCIKCFPVTYISKQNNIDN